MNPIAWMTPSDALTRDAVTSNSADELELLREWLRDSGDLFDAVAFQVRLGSGRVATVGALDAADRMWRACTQVRADAVAKWHNGVYVIEVKVEARMDAVSQVNRYARLFREDYPGREGVRPVIVCRRASASVDYALKQAFGFVVRMPIAAAAAS